MSIKIRLLMETATPEKKSWLRHCSGQANNERIHQTIQTACAHVNTHTQHTKNSTLVTSPQNTF